MRVAIISDIHGNLAALDRVLNTIRFLRADLIYCLGDIVGYGPFPNECVELVRQHCAVVIKGNHDSGAVGETPPEKFTREGAKVLAWTRGHLTLGNFEYLKRLPYMRIHQGLTLVHASPDEPAKWKYILSPDIAEKSFKAFTTDLCFIGHSHLPTIIGEDGSVNEPMKDIRYIINVGSVGQPRDLDSRAAFGFIDTSTFAYQLMRVEYDIKATVDAVRKIGLPRFQGRRLFDGV